MAHRKLEKNQAPVEVAEGFAQRLANRRSEKTWTIKQLAEIANVSPNTIAAIESGAHKRRIRFDVVVRLATALEEPIAEWLQLAGYVLNERSREKVSVLLARTKPVQASTGPEPSPRINPVKYFERLAERTKSASGVMICCYTSPPAAADDESIQLRAALTECLANGLCIGMICPYPKSDVGSSEDEQILAKFYESVLSAIRTAAISLGGGAQGVYQHQIVMLVPRQPCLLVFPPLRLVEYRPALVCLRATTESEKVEKVEFGVWMKAGIWARDEWVTIDPAVGTREAKALADQAVDTWRAYFGDVLKAWKVKGQNGTWDHDVLNASKRWTIEPLSSVTRRL